MPSENAAPRGQYLPLAACLAICLIGPLSGLAQAGLAPILPAISAHFADVPDSGFLVRLMISGLTAAMIVGALASGFLAERIGQQRLLLICLVIYAVAGAAGYVLDNLYLLVASRLILGVVMSALGGLAVSLITTEIAPATRDRWLGFFLVFGTASAIVMIGIIGVIGQADWRNVFLLYLLALPIAAVVALTFPGAAPVVLPSETAASTAKGRGFPWQMMLVAMMIGATGTTIFMYLPYRLAGLDQGRPDQLAPMLMISTAVMSLGSVAHGWIRRRFSPVTLFTIPMLVAAVGIAGLALAEQRFALLVSIGIFGAGFGLVIPHMFSACAAATPVAYRPRMIGFVRAAFYVGPLVAQLGLEILNGRFGPGAAMIGVAGIAVAGGLLAAAFRGQFVPVEEPESSPV